MKALLTFIVLLLLAFVAVGVMQGWLHFGAADNKATIEVETDELERAADRAKQGGQHLLEEAGEALERAGEKLQESSDEPSDVRRERRPRIIRPELESASVEMLAVI